MTNAHGARGSLAQLNTRGLHMFRDDAAWMSALVLVGTVAMLAWLDARLFLVAVAAMPFGIWALVRYRGRLEAEVAALRQRSADIGSFLIETLQAMRLVVASNAQDARGRAIPRRATTRSSAR